MKNTGSIIVFTMILCACSFSNKNNSDKKTPQDSITISKKAYQNKLEGFWLGQCIGNWTGLVTEMDKIGNIGDIQTGPFYTREDWKKADQPSIWGQGIPIDLSKTIDFVLRDSTQIWGADDDTIS